MKPLFRVLDLFAGAGGLSEGFRLSHFYEVIGAVESNVDAARTYEENHPGIPLLQNDIRDLGRKELLAIADGRIDVVVGGPPCQGFSIAGPRDESHPSLELAFEFARAVEEVRPRAFVLENVPGLLSFQGGTAVDRLVRRLAAAAAPGRRYNVVLDVLDAAAYGVPQHRKRLLICGIDGPAFRFPAPRAQRITLGDAIGDLPLWTAQTADEVLELPKSYPLTPYQKDRRRGAGALFNHSAKGLQEVRRERLAHLVEGDDKGALPDHLQAGGRASKYRRLRSSSPSPTVLAHMAHDTSGFIHPHYERMLTVREAARLQSFDDRYRFFGSQYQQFKQVGNAVPPLLAAELAKSLAVQIAGGGRRGSAVQTLPHP